MQPKLTRDTSPGNTEECRRLSDSDSTYQTMELYNQRSMADDRLLPALSNVSNFQTVPFKAERKGYSALESTTDDVVAHDDFHRWSPSGSWTRDLLHFVGPGWFVSIAYVDPGNYQADIQAGATSKYSLLFTLWWTSVLSLYVQVLCVRLAYYGQVTLAEAQARDATSNWKRYTAWFIAEFSAVITDLPEVRRRHPPFPGAATPPTPILRRSAFLFAFLPDAEYWTLAVPIRSQVAVMIF